MTEVDGVALEKAEAMRKYNNHKTYKNLLRSLAVAFLCYLWFPTLQIIGDWFYQTGSVFLTNHMFVFLVVNLLIVTIFVLSRDDMTRTEIEPDLCDRFMSYETVIETGSVNDCDLGKQIVPVPEVIVVVEEVNSNREVIPVTVKGEFRRTKSEKAKKKVNRPVKEYRRTESANIERMSSEEFRLKVETFIMKNKRSIVLENDVMDCHSRPRLVGVLGSDVGSGGYGSC